MTVEAEKENALSPLAEGLWRLRLPMRFNPGHINSYLLRDPEGWTVVDCGNHSRETRETWTGFIQSPDYGPGIHRIILTHAHPDHAGSACWLAKETGADVWMAAAEEDAYNRLWRGSTDSPEALKAFFAYWGASDAQQDNILLFMEGFHLGCPSIETTVNYLSPGESLQAGGRHWALHGGYGHTPCNLLLLDRADGWIITGDQVLPRIQPNVSLWFGATTDPVGDYLDSLMALALLPVRQACPAHGDVFDNFPERCAQLERQVHRRLDRLETALANGVSDIAGLCDAVLGKASEGPLFMLVAGQLYALLAWLERRGRVVRIGEGEFLRFVPA